MAPSQKPSDLKLAKIIHDSPRILWTPSLKPPMPQQVVNRSSSRRDITIIAPQSKLHVYSRQQNLQATEVQPLEYCHELESIANPNKGNSISPSIPPSNLDIPISIRKGIISCTMHPISKYVSYHRLSPTLNGFTAHLSGLGIFFPIISKMLYLFQNGDKQLWRRWELLEVSELT